MSDDAQHPNKYIPDEPSLRFSKDKLYKLHWGYGLSVNHIEALSDVTSRSSIRDQFREFGIPMREYRTHKNWEPHHNGVPPMFEWPDNGEIENPYSDRYSEDYKPSMARKPEVSDDD